MNDMEGDQEEGGDSGGGGSMPAGLMLMDVLAWTSRRNKERKVFFFTQAALCGSGDRKGQGCVPRCTVPVLFISLFFPPGPQSSWGRAAQKVLAFSQAPKNLASSQGSATFDELLHNNQVI